MLISSHLRTNNSLPDLQVEFWPLIFEDCQQLKQLRTPPALTDLLGRYGSRIRTPTFFLKSQRLTTILPVLPQSFRTQIQRKTFIYNMRKGNYSIVPIFAMQTRSNIGGSRCLTKGHRLLPPGKCG